MSRAHPHQISPTQRGAALMIMLVIMVIGIASVLVGSLNSSALNNSRQQQTSAALAQAKEALIGIAASYTDYPGGLPCPDTDNDGISEAGGSTECPSYIGRLPWKTLGLPDLRDGSGERLWYTLSNSVRRYAAVRPLNSDTQGTLNITGTQTASNVMAIIFAAGNPLSGQSRSPNNTTPCSSTASSPIAENLCAKNYLEGTNQNKSSASGGGVLNTNYQAGAPTDNLLNDQLLYITHDQLFPVIEMRIAREVKSCLDSYASTQGKKYPWAVPVKNGYFSGEVSTRFGRIPFQPPIADPDIQTFLSALANLQTAVDACVANDTGGNANTLDNAGTALENAAKALRNAQPSNPAIPGAVTTPGIQAGDNAQINNMCDTINITPTTNSVQTNLDTTTAALTSALSGSIATSNSNQAVKCSLFSTSYWPDWKNLIFYQVDNNYTPTASATGSGSIKINNSGNYRATVLVARQIISPQIRTVLSDPPIGYLEGGNAHTAVNPANNFIYNRPVEAGFTGVNDLVLCLDGQQTCK